MRTGALEGGRAARSKRLVAHRARRARRGAAHRRRPRPARRARRLRRLAGPLGPTPRSDNSSSPPGPFVDSPRHARRPRHRRRRAREALRGVAAVDGCSFTVEPGEVFGLLGPNGAGKTTTVEILEGYRRPDAGQVRVLGLDPGRDGAALRPRIGVMLQAGGLYPGLRPLELLRLFAAYYDDPESPDALLETVGLRDTSAHAGAPAVGRSGAAALARVRADRQTRSRVPRRTDGRHGPARTRDDMGARAHPRRATARPSCSRPTPWTRPSNSATASRSSPAGRLAALGTPAELTRHAAGEEMWFAADTRPRPHRARGRARRRPPTRCSRSARASTCCSVPGTPQRIADLALLPARPRRHARGAAGRTALARRGLPPDHRRSRRAERP